MMRVFSRSKSETLVIGDVRVTVLDILADKVRIAIEAPRDVPVHRLEVWKTTQAEKGK